MPARLMQGRCNTVKEYLLKQGRSKNEIDHLMENRNNLVITKIKVATYDGEEYELPYEFVFVVKEKP